MNNATTSQTFQQQLSNGIQVIKQNEQRNTQLIQQSYSQIISRIQNSERKDGRLRTFQFKNQQKFKIFNQIKSSSIYFGVSLVFFFYLPLVLKIIWNDVNTTQISDAVITTNDKAFINFCLSFCIPSAVNFILMLIFMCVDFKNLLRIKQLQITRSRQQWFEKNLQINKNFRYSQALIVYFLVGFQAFGAKLFKQSKGLLSIPTHPDIDMGRLYSSVIYGLMGILIILNLSVLVWQKKLNQQYSYPSNQASLHSKFLPTEESKANI